MNLIGKLPVIFRFLKANIQILGLCGTRTDEASKALFRALKAALQFRVTPEEKEWVHKIELLRKELNSSTQTITRIIFGLPPDCPNPPGKQVQNGRLVTETIGQACRRASRQRLWCLLLFKLIREFKPSVCLEMGTSLGISASYQAAALTLNRHGKLITLEGDETMASLAERHFRSLGLDRVMVVTGQFQNTLDGVLNEHGPIDYVFVDADKDEKTVLQYFERIYPFLSPRAVLVFDDIHWSSSMEDAWKKIERDERVKVSIDLTALGVCIVDRDLNGKECFKVPVG